MVKELSEKEKALLKNTIDAFETEAITIKDVNLNKELWNSWFKGFIAGVISMAIISLLILIGVLVSCK